MTLEIIGFPRSNFVRAVRMVAEEKGVPYELLAEFPHSDTVKDLNPTGKIPAMRHDGLELCESLAIARYIDDAFDGPKMIPEDVKAAAHVNRWTAFAATEVDQLLMRNYVVRAHQDRQGSQAFPENVQDAGRGGVRRVLRHRVVQYGRLLHNADPERHQYVGRRQRSHRQFAEAQRILHEESGPREL